MEEKDLIRIRWHVNRDVDPCEYTLRSVHPDHPDLVVGVSSAEMTERVAKARLMERMYALGKEKGIAPQRLRFKINGVED